MGITRQRGKNGYAQSAIPLDAGCAYRIPKGKALHRRCVRIQDHGWTSSLGKFQPILLYSHLQNRGSADKSVLPLFNHIELLNKAGAETLHHCRKLSTGCSRFRRNEAIADTFHNAVSNRPFHRLQRPLRNHISISERIQIIRLATVVAPAADTLPAS